MSDHPALRVVRRLAGLATELAGLAAATAALLEALGLHRRRPDTAGPDVDALAARLTAVEDRWVEFDRNWPEPYRRAAATAAFDRVGGGTDA